VGLSIWAIERMNPKAKSADKSDKLDKLALSVQPDRDRDILQQLCVRDAMDTNYLRLSDRLDLLAAGLQLTQSNCHSALVIDDLQEPIGIVTLHDLSRAISQAEATAQPNYLLTNYVGNICSKNLFYADIDEPITDAIDRMNARGLHQLPVIDSSMPQQVVGILQQERIALACSVAATRQALSKYQMSVSMPVATLDCD
jgi:CBS-domain-containing membrane protein